MSKRRTAMALAATASLAIASITTAFAASLSDLRLVKVASGLDSPLTVRHAGDGSGRLFVVERAGVIKILERSGTLLPTPFLDIRALVKSGGEQGLLGLDFHPDYEANGFFYVNYIRSNGAGQLDRTVVARYSVSADPTIADSNSALVLLEFEQDFANHNGGDIHFGADGYLYIASGDGGSGRDPNNRAQSLDTLLGKMLRIDVDGAPPAQPNDLCGLNPKYGIPPDNPYVGGSGDCDEIWTRGLRNPWRWSFDRSTHDMFIGDVGQGQIEEIDFQPATSGGGENYGWSCMEGNIVQNFNACAPGLLTPPILSYDHSLGCSVTGGYRYRGSAIGALQGVYIYGDFCSGRIWFATQNTEGWSSTLWMDTDLNISSFGEDENSEIYVADFTNGEVYRIESPITVSIEEPAANETKSGIANFRGFATTPVEDCPIGRVELFIDGAFRGNIPLGGARADVCTVFANPDCAISGYSQAINYSELDEGPHSARVRAVDCLGNFTETGISFSTDRFATPFISDGNAVNFLNTDASIDPDGDGLDKRILLRSVAADEQCYDVTLDYATAIQGWKIVSIQQIPDTECL